MRRRYTSCRGILAALLTACANSAAPNDRVADHLTARPGTPTASIATGMHVLGLGTSVASGITTARDGVIYVPASYSGADAIPLVLLLHGSTGSGSDWFGSYAQRAEKYGFVMLAPDSRSYTWDLLASNGYGADVSFIDRALAWTFDRVRIDPARIAIAGFSDGASYTLSLGLSNGDLFSRAIAYSPCVFEPGELRGKPPVFISHGLQDGVLPIDQCSRVLVPALRSRGYEVNYIEFTGGHQVPQEMSDSAMAWLARGWK